MSVGQCLREILKKIPLFYKLGHEIHQAQYAREKCERQQRLAAYGKDTARAVVQLAAREGWPLFPTYGTLLGLLREGHFLAHDDDLDFGLVDDGSWDWTELDLALEGAGFALERSLCYGEERWESTYRRAGLGLDIFRYVEGTQEDFPPRDPALPDQRPASYERMACSYWFVRRSDLSYSSTSAYTPVRMRTVPILPLEARTFRDLTCLVPTEAEILLADFYGEGWRVPDPQWKSGSGRANELLRDELGWSKRPEELL